MKIITKITAVCMAMLVCSQFAFAEPIAYTYGTNGAVLSRTTIDNTGAKTVVTNDASGRAIEQDQFGVDGTETINKLTYNQTTGVMETNTAYTQAKGAASPTETSETYSLDNGNLQITLAATQPGSNGSDSACITPTFTQMQDAYTALQAAANKSGNNGSSGMTDGTTLGSELTNAGVAGITSSNLVVTNVAVTANWVNEGTLTTSGAERSLLGAVMGIAETVSGSSTHENFDTIVTAVAAIKNGGSANMQISGNNVSETTYDVAGGAISTAGGSTFTCSTDPLVEGTNEGIKQVTDSKGVVHYYEVVKANTVDMYDGKGAQDADGATVYVEVSASAAANLQSQAGKQVEISGNVTADVNGHLTMTMNAGGYTTGDTAAGVSAAWMSANKGFYNTTLASMASTWAKANASGSDSDWQSGWNFLKGAVASPNF